VPWHAWRSDAYASKCALTPEQLEGVPQPFVALVEVLLEKNPAMRFQNPTELLKIMPTLRSLSVSR
jgi:hypothetical protein